MRIVGIGVDVVEVQRIRDLLESRPGFRDRVFTSSEIVDCQSEADPGPCFAARWAAREAAAKALGGVPKLDWHEIAVRRGPDGDPHLSLEGKARARAQEVGARELLVSLSHEKSVAAAFCVAVGGES
ncbi:MAG: holo-ACP synthase [Actinomycetota bacterium]